MTLSVADIAPGTRTMRGSAAAMGRRLRLCAADYRPATACCSIPIRCGRSRSGSGSWTITQCLIPTSIPSPCAAQPWISTQWLAQVLYAKAYAWFGWSGPVVLAAAAIASTFALLARFLDRYLRDSTTLVFVAAALVLTLPHQLARPHVLALPLCDRLDRRTDRCRRSARGAVVLAVAADGAVGQSPWRLCLRPGADRTDCARLRWSARKPAIAKCDWSLRWAVFAALALGRRLAARPMAGMRCWRQKRSSSSAARCR